MWLSARLWLPLCCAAPVAAQDPDLPGMLERLPRERDRARAIAELRRNGPAATDAVADALERASASELPHLASALAELPGSAGAVAALLEAIPKADAAERDALLHALGNCVPPASADPDLLARIGGAVDAWARTGLFYSPSAEQPTFAWYEYVRLRRRLALGRGGLDPDALAARLQVVRAERASFRGDAPMAEVGNLGRFGRHGTREELEAIAELVLQAGPAARELCGPLFDYLQHEPPRPARVLTEHCAGIGETAPDDRAAAKFPTQWRRDDWRFACARAIFALDREAVHRMLALRHLLHSPSAAERIEALAAVRAQPQPWRDYAAELAARVDDADRAVVREALITLGLAGAETRAAVSEATLRRLAEGADRELGLLARRLLQRN